MMVHLGVVSLALPQKGEDHQEMRTAAAHLEMHMALARPVGGLVVHPGHSGMFHSEVRLETHTVARPGVRLDISTMLVHPVVRPEADTR